MNEHFKTERSVEYNQRFTIEHLTFSQKNETNKDTLEQVLRKKIQDSNIHEKKIIFDTEKQEVEIRNIKIHDEFLLLFVSVADKSAKLAVSPGKNHVEDQFHLNDYNTHHVFMLINENKIYGCIKIRPNKLYTRINSILKHLLIDGKATEDIDIKSIDLVNEEGIRGFIYQGHHSSEDLIDYNNQKKYSTLDKSIRFFKRLFDSAPPVLDHRIVGDIHIALKDNEATIKADPEQHLQEIIDDLHPGLILVTKKGKRIIGQDFATKAEYYLREHTKDTVTYTAAFETLEYYFKYEL